MSPDPKVRSIIAEVNPMSPISEAYRKLRTNLKYSESEKALKVLMVTSAGAKEGKSTTAVNLAAVYAQAGQRVLLLDCDMRKPTVHQTFALSNRNGLSQVLSGQAEWGDAVQSTRIKNVHALTSGPVPPNPSELLDATRMDRLLEQLREHYDIVLIDTPPVLAVSDAQIMATRCDGVLLVVNARGAKRRETIKAREALLLVKAKIVGVALNGTPPREGYSYYEYSEQK
ncbi:CpsD/CapB family tyrosine-protein kinase [Paenibacillus terricola]|nr:CpsD/CapB family tyrosine-protein kinase [Paenibacillus terricola]